MAFGEDSRRVLRQLPCCARRNSEAHGKHFAPVVKVPETHLRLLAGVWLTIYCMSLPEC